MITTTTKPNKRKNTNRIIEKNNKKEWKKETFDIKPNLFFIVLKLLFPLFPIKLMSSVHLIVFMGALVAIRLILSQFSIPFLVFGFNISFAWLPVYVAGFFFGPIIGLLFGIAMDSLTFAINGGIWFWMYAIQEPIIGFISGIIGSLYLYNVIKSIKIQMIIQQIVVIIFSLCSIIIIIYEFFILDAKFQTSGMQNITTFAIISIIIMLLYLCINEIQFIYFYKKNKTIKQTNFLSMYLYVSLLLITVTILFSFILGPITFVEYTKYITGSEPNSFIKYGSMYYLIPRVLKESVKTPIYIILLFGIILTLKTPITRFICLSKNSWK